MAKKTYDLKFDGYYEEAKVPTKAGIYVVYRGTFSKETDKVTLHRVLYIGQAENALERIKEHGKKGGKRTEWKRLLEQGDSLWLSFAPSSSEGDRLRAECALIFINNPPTNIECKDTFNHDETVVNVSGTTTKLKGGTAKKTE